MRIFYLPQLKGGHGVLNKNWNRQGHCTEGARKRLVGGEQFSAPEAGGAHGRALLVAQGVGPASLLPVPPTGSHRHCPPSPLLGRGHGKGRREESGLRPPTLQDQSHLSVMAPLPVLGSFSWVSGPFSSLTPSSRPMSDRAFSRPAKSPPAS